MKKSLLIVPSLFVLALTSCGTVVEEFDKNKTQIFVNVFNGGYGTEWFDDLKTKFNAQNNKYQIISRYKKMEATDIITDVQSGNPDADIYFSCGVDFQAGILKGYFEDLSDVLNMTPQGDTRTIKDKIVDYELWQKLASKRNEGIYILPHTQTLMGMVFDYQQFVDNGWLSFASAGDATELANQGITYTTQGGRLKFVSSTKHTNYKEGDYILSAGKDGLFGTYDDGQPKTMDEFDTMLKVITNGSSAKTFIFSGTAENYLNDFYSAVIGQYAGADNYKALFNFDSKGNQVEMHNKESKAVALANGYDIYKSEAVYQGLNFVEKYLTSKDVDSNVKSTSSFTHTDAQNRFLLSYKESSGYPTMLVEGTWWENEAKTTFAKIAEEKPERGYGKREYRYFLTPNIEGQKTATNRSVMGGAEYAGVVVAKQKDANKLAKIKEFLAFCNSDENLKNFTKFSGCKKYFKYDLSQTEIDSLTPFARNNYEIMSDTEHIDIIPSRLYQACNPLTFTTTFISNCYIPLYTGTIYSMWPARYFRDIAKVDELYTTKSNMLGYSKEQWDEFIKKAQEQGFLK